MNEEEDDDLKVLPFERKLSRKSNIDEIILWYQNPNPNTKLSESLHNDLKRYKQCQLWLDKDLNIHKVAPMMVREFGYSLNTAYRDIRDTFMIFNVLSSQSYKGRDFMIDIVMGRIMKNEELARGKEDYKSAAQFTKQMIDVIEKFYGGYEAKQYDSLQPPNILLGWYPEQFKTKLPADWEHQRDMFIKHKKKRAFSFESEDAKEVE